MSKTIFTHIQHKREFEINWLDSNYVPLQGELIIYLRETDHATKAILTTKKNGVDTPVVPCGKNTPLRTTPYSYDRVKLGDGKTPVSDLPFFNNNGIECGTTDPNADTIGQFYFKYSTQ